MERFFHNRRFLITGAASGIGCATARLLAERGARLRLWDLHEEPLQALARELTAEAQVVDVVSLQQIDQALADMERLSGVVHSAGILRTGLFEEIPLEEHLHQIEVNLSATVQLTYRMLPRLKETGGSLVLLGSSSAFYGPPEFNTYGATKAAVLNFAQSLRVEWEGNGVHLGVVCPMFVGSPMLNESNRRAKLVQRFGMTHTPEEVARAIVKGIERRRFMIYPSWKPRILEWISHKFYYLGHRLMRWNWR